jgi:uncharacterized protein
MRSLPAHEPVAAPPRGRSRPLRLAWAIAWRLLLWFVLWGMFAAPFVVPLGSLLAGWAHQHPLRAQIWGDWTVALALLLASWLMTRFVDRIPLAAIGLSPRRAGRDLVVGIGLGVAWIGASLGAAWLVGCLAWQPLGRVSIPALAGAAVSLVGNVLGQQLLLCGYTLRTLRARLGLPVAVVVGAALFSLCHAPAFHGAWLPAVNVFAAGLVFALARSASGNLWLPMGMHLAWNGLLGPVLGLSVSGSDQLARGWSAFALRGPVLLCGGDFGLEGGLLVTLTTALAVAVFVRRARRARAGGGGEATPGRVDGRPSQTL